MTSFDVGTAVRNAWKAGLVVPSFNVPYLPMVEPVIRAAVDEDAFALVATARLEWYKFAAKGPEYVAEAYFQHENPAHVRLHLDHVPVIDEDDLRVDYLPVIARAIELGYHSVMVDGSRLPLEANIAATREVAELAHQSNIPCEAELGAVLGHEAGPLPPYEELFASGKGFTDVEQARRFVSESGCDWLSVAAGNIHGAISGAKKDQAKVEARLDLAHLSKLNEAANVPLVLHGGSGIQRYYVRESFLRGIAKMNIGTDIRQTYERALSETRSTPAAQDAVYERTRYLLREELGLSATCARVTGQGQEEG
ncbi:MAG: class II fructose-bisphosphate aldolase [Anaerolineae bacterium]